MNMDRARSRERIIIRGGKIYYSIEAAKAAITDLKVKNMTVVGIDGFRLTDRSTEPLLACIAHWPGVPCQPWDKYVELCAGHALEVLQLWERTSPKHFMVSSESTIVAMKVKVRSDNDMLDNRL